MGSEMGMGDVEVLLRVAGDSSGAQKAVADWEQKVRTGTATATELFAVNARKMGKSSDDVRASLQAMGATAKEQSLAMATAFGEIPAAIEPAKASVNSFGQAVRSQLGDLLVLRRAMYASFGLISFGYIISEWESVAKAIKNAAQALGGYDAYLQQVQQDAISFSTAAFQSGGGDLQQKLLEAAKNAKTLVGFEKERVQLELQYAQAAKQRTTQELNVELPLYYERQKQLDALSSKINQLNTESMQLYGPAAGAILARRDALQQQADAMQKLQNASTFAGHSLKQLAQIEKELSKTQTEAQKRVLALEIQIQTQRLSGAQKADRQQETAEHRREASLIRVNGQIAAAQKQQAALSSEMDNYAARHLAQQIHQIEQESKQAQANIAKAKASQDALNFDIEKRGPLKGSLSEMWAGSAGINKMVLEDNQRALKQWQKLVEEGNRKALASYQQLGEGVRRSFDIINQELEMMGNRHLRTFGMVGSILQQSIEAEKRSAAASGAAAMSKTQFAIGALKQLAPVKAEVDVAKGLEALGDFNFWSAAQYFAGAAMWGTIGTAQIAGMVSGAGGGGRGGRGGSGSASRNNGAGGSRSGGGSGSGDSGQQVVPSGNFATPPKNGNLTIAIMGDTEAGVWMAGAINKAVQQGGAELTATHTTALPQPMA